MARFLNWLKNKKLSDTDKKVIGHMNFFKNSFYGATNLDWQEVENSPSPDVQKFLQDLKDTISKYGKITGPNGEPKIEGQYAFEYKIKQLYELMKQARHDIYSDELEQGQGHIPTGSYHQPVKSPEKTIPGGRREGPAVPYDPYGRRISSMQTKPSMKQPLNDSEILFQKIKELEQRLAALEEKERQTRRLA